MLTEHVSLDLKGRIDAYNLNTTLVSNSQVTEIQDRMNYAVMLGLVYRFGETPKPQKTMTPVLAPAPIVVVDEDNDSISDNLDQCPHTLTNVPVDKNGCPLPAFSLTLAFEFARFTLQDLTDKPTFDVVAFLQANPDYKVVITGHTDNVGQMSFNQQLSEQRAKSAASYLIKNSISAERILTTGRGSEQPIASNETESGRAMNRRIVVDFYNPTNAAKERP